MREYTGKITKELCEKEILLFFPKTEAEAIFIQKKLFEMGYSWGGNDKTVKYIEDSISSGMVLEKRDLFYNPRNFNKKHGLLCTAAQFDQHYDPKDIKNLVGDDLVREVFNRLSERIGDLEAEIQELKNPTIARKLKPADPANG